MPKEVFLARPKEGAYALRSMFNAMSHPTFAKTPQAATRHLPVAHSLDRSGEPRSIRPSTTSETRLQAAVVREDSSSDPYADVPCTD
jgi:hypothetical protein